MFRPRERAFKQFKCPRPQCVNIRSRAKPKNETIASVIDGGQNPLEIALRPNYKDQSVNTVESCNLILF